MSHSILFLNECRVTPFIQWEVYNKTNLLNRQVDQNKQEAEAA